MTAFLHPARLARLACLLILSACSTPSPVAPPPAPAAPVARPQPAPVAPTTPHISAPAHIAPAAVAAAAAPALPREFRGVWVSTVANIDWPSKKGLPSSQQQAEMRALLDAARDTGCNAIVLQVRPAGDAVYASEREPWSEFLSGTQGKAPQPLYDPLAKWIEEAHKRGLELHAWFNPYRARSASTRGALARSHLSNTAPDAVRAYGDLLWMDPGHPAAAEQTRTVILDVVRRYDVDGIHLDDYFYPYPIKDGAGNEIDFPDEASYTRYQFSGGQASRADWRRAQVSTLVETLSREIHRIKPWLKFGVSPFGIGRLERQAPGITGFSQYDRLYADVETWLEQGWVDYLAPQLYWPIDAPAQAFKTLQTYWRNQNPRGRHIWPGLFASKVEADDRGWPASELLNQIDATRIDGGTGHLLFSMVALAQNRQALASRIHREKYAEPAAIPAFPWLHDAELLPPQLHDLPASAQAPHRLLAALPGHPAARWLAIWRRYASGWKLSIQSAEQPEIDLPEYNGEPVEAVEVSFLNRIGQESRRSSWPTAAAAKSAPP